MNKIQRQILINQYEILKQQTKYPQLQNEYDKKIEILSKGYSDLYNEIIFDLDDELDDKTSKKVYEILDMFRVIYNSIRGVKINDTLGLKCQFKGFDLLYESKYYGFCYFILNKLELYKESYLKNLQSSSPMLNIYEEMLQEWRKLKNKKNLSLDEIEQICKYNI